MWEKKIQIIDIISEKIKYAREIVYIIRKHTLLYINIYIYK